MSPNTRKNRMRLLASFYEIAARFTEKELIDIRDEIGGDSLSKELSSLILSAHDNLPNGVGRPREGRVLQGQQRESVSTPRRREAALKEILSSRELFSSPRDISDNVPGAAELRPKESREKYVNRILTQFRTLSSSEQLNFTSALQKRLEIKGSGNFVSRWSRLIREI